MPSAASSAAVSTVEPPQAKRQRLAVHAPNNSSTTTRPSRSRIFAPFRVIVCLLSHYAILLILVVRPLASFHPPAFRLLRSRLERLPFKLPPLSAAPFTHTTSSAV